MVKASDINRDIKTIAHKVKTAVFSYDEIHNSSIQNKFHYDYQKVISEVSRIQEISEEKAIQQLVDRNILSALPNGEYKINVGKGTETGGGVNYGGNYFFSMSSRDYATKYHELAHSLQHEYNLFSDEKINEIYRRSAQGVKEDEDKLIDRNNYNLYLNEMHSESFSYAALMLRAENKLDFIWQELNAYNMAIKRNVTGFISFGKTEYGTAPLKSAKFYATMPVMKETIKKVRQIRKMGKTRDFFDENGVLKDEKLARMCEEIVIRKAYSPRTLKSYFEYNVIDGHRRDEHGWRRDTIKAVLLTAPAVIITARETKILQTIKSIKSHINLKKEERKKVSKYLKTMPQYADPEIQALKDYEKLQILRSQLKDESSAYFQKQVETILQNGDMPECVARYRQSVIEKRCGEKRFGFALKTASEIIKNNRDNSYFKALVEGRANIIQTRNLINEKENNPSQRVVFEKDFPSQVSKGSNLYALMRSMELIEDFCTKYKIEQSIMTKILETRIHSPMKMDTAAYRSHMAEDIVLQGNIKGFKRKKMMTEFGQLLDQEISLHYEISRDLQYQEELEKLKQVPPAELRTWEIKETVSRRMSIDEQTDRTWHRSVENEVVKDISPEILDALRPKPKHIPLEIPEVDPLQKPEIISPEILDDPLLMPEIIPSEILEEEVRVVLEDVRTTKSEEEKQKSLTGDIISSVKESCGKAAQSLKEKIVAQKQKTQTPEEKHRKAYQTVQIKRGVIEEKKTKGIKESAREQTIEEIATIQSPQQRDGR